MRANFLMNMLPMDNNQTTIELRELVEAGMCLFDPNDKYPIWDEKHRPELEKKIIEHYYDRQIGFETPGKFKFKLNARMREIMPRYVKLFKTTQYDYNPIENYNMLEGSDDTSESSGTTTANGIEKFSDTPQNDIGNLDDHLTNATTSESSGDSTSKNSSKHTAYRHGNIGVTSTQQLIEQERKITIDLDMMIIDDLKTLFLGVL